jgi:hypothetical protein
MVEMPEIDVVKESLKIENDSLKVFSIALITLVVLLVLKKGKQ